MNQINPNFTSCIYNLLYIQYNEIFGREEYFYYDLAYPVFYNVKNGYFQVDKQILDNLNKTVYSNINTFRDVSRLVSQKGLDLISFMMPNYV